MCKVLGSLREERDFLQVPGGVATGRGKLKGVMIRKLAEQPAGIFLIESMFRSLSVQATRCGGAGSVVGEFGYWFQHVAGSARGAGSLDGLAHGKS